MSTISQSIIVSYIRVEISRKNIKNIRLTVHQPEGRVKISVPYNVDTEQVRLFIFSRLDWIKSKQEIFRKQPRQSIQKYVTGEIHFFAGKRYILHVREKHGKHKLEIIDNDRMLLTVSPGTSMKNRALVINRWYRQHLNKIISDMIAKWEPVIGKRVNDWGIKNMKTRWGSCNIKDHRIWLNLELAKKSPECLEYVLVHELVHLHERNHNSHFKSLMDKYLPQWRQYRATLMKESLAAEARVY